MPASPDVWDEQLGWIKGQAGAAISVSCRAVPNGAGNQVQLADGKITNYEFDVVFPLGTQAIPEGVIVTITGINGETLKNDRLLRFQTGQLHSKGWI
jgi:hypothetical protein